MWLIAGLGNPGPRYARTRHNVGFMAADELAALHAIEFRERALYRTGKGSIGDEEVILLEPLTFMNRSGVAVKEIMAKRSIRSDRLIVIHDDIDMETGRLRIRKRGSSGGHRGIESVIESIGTREFVRIKIGVGRQEGVPAEAYVLQKIGKDEKPIIQEAVARTAEAVILIIREGVDKAMNIYNKMVQDSVSDE